MLGSIIDPDQTCSIPGRSILSNLVLLRDTLAFIERTGEAGILLSLDQEKAFDRVDRICFNISVSDHGFDPAFRLYTMERLCRSWSTIFCRILLF